jgi:hypothetical protein
MKLNTHLLLVLRLRKSRALLLLLPSAFTAWTGKTLPLLPVPWTKKQLKLGHFSSDTEAIAAAETWLDGQSSEFFFSVSQKLEQRAKKSIELRGKYIE